MTTVAANSTLVAEVARRRTFAIISHPDAGKTTLTEKLLLYAGAIELAGAVRGRKAQRARRLGLDGDRAASAASRSRRRRSSSRSTGTHVTLLDTPGHKDFSEDTYRTLLAADSVVMVIDAAKGIEPQTRKLFEVCRGAGCRSSPSSTSSTSPARDPLELLDEIERVLGIPAAPMNWPIGSGDRFRGVYDLEQRDRAASTSGRRRAQDERRCRCRPRTTRALARAARRSEPWQHLIDETLARDRRRARRSTAEAYRAGRQTPVFFGSALTNFGVEPFLQALDELAPPPRARAERPGR